MLDTGSRKNEEAAGSCFELELATIGRNDYWKPTFNTLIGCLNTTFITLRYENIYSVLNSLINQHRTPDNL